MSATEINGINYRAGKLTPREQFHVLRRMGPLLGGVAPAISALLDGSKTKADVIIEMVGSLGPMTTILASMSDADVDYVMNVCMGRVERQQGEKWYPVYTFNGARPVAMYQDIDLMTELRCTAMVIEGNLAGFIAALSGESVSLLGASLSGAARN